MLIFGAVGYVASDYLRAYLNAPQFVNFTGVFLAGVIYQALMGYELAEEDVDTPKKVKKAPKAIKTVSCAIEEEDEYAEGTLGAAVYRKPMVINYRYN